MHVPFAWNVYSSTEKEGIWKGSFEFFSFGSSFSNAYYHAVPCMFRVCRNVWVLKLDSYSVAMQWKEHPCGITIKIVPWITKVPFVSSNCNISAVCNLQWNKKTISRHSISTYLKYIYSFMFLRWSFQKRPEHIGEL
jgi:hypothetical protein